MAGKKRRSAAQKAATKRMLAGLKKKRAAAAKRKHPLAGYKGKKRIGRGSRKKSTGFFRDASGWERASEPTRMATAKRRKKSGKKRAKKRAKKAHHKTARKTTRKSHKTVTFASIKKAARQPKIWVCVGRIKTGCGGGKRGGHVLGGIRIG